IGYTPEQLQAVIESVAGTDLTDFSDRYLDGLEDLPFNEYLQPFGLQLVPEKEEEPYLGVRVSTENGREMIKFVESGSPAQAAGLDAGDELLAIDGLKVGSNQLGDRLKDYRPDDKIQVSVFHQDELRTYKVNLAAPHPQKYQLQPVANPDATQQENFAGWLGVPLTSIK
ncbi:MAG TPA: PDZ domain-containing protein, partial [Nostocaceae cyanobacterium]|nr:PDZ domain-containing protein [Nostocaceae cyanobacterium]